MAKRNIGNAEKVFKQQGRFNYQTTMGLHKDTTKKAICKDCKWSGNIEDCNKEENILLCPKCKSWKLYSA